MKLTVIEGGKGRQQGDADGFSASSATTTAEEVRREAERRLRALGWGNWQNRQVLTGAGMPREIRYLAMQITYAAEAIIRLAAIPADFRSDLYWPGAAPAAVKTAP